MALSFPIWVDTWGWYALGDKAERLHKGTAEIYHRTRAGEVYTSDFVMDETLTLLFRKLPFDTAKRFMNALFESADRGHIQIVSVTSEIFKAAWTLRLRYADKPLISFTDLTSMALMRENRIHYILTQDQHFEQVRMGFTLLPSPRM